MYSESTIILRILFGLNNLTIESISTIVKKRMLNNLVELLGLIVELS
jgi:hypothetical protein